MTETEIAEQKVAEEKKAVEEAAKKVAFEKRQEMLKEKSNEDLITIINDVNTEARDRRMEKNKLEDDLKKLVDEQKKREENKLIEDGKLKELIEAKTSELSDMGIKVSDLQIKADEFSEFKASKIEAAKAKLGDKWQEGYAKLSLLELDNLVNTMSEKSVITGDNGAAGYKIKMTLTEAQKKEAYQRYPHLPPATAEEYMKHNLITENKKDK